MLAADISAWKAMAVGRLMQLRDAARAQLR
jgi:hypothetical protein